MNQPPPYGYGPPPGPPPYYPPQAPVVYMQTNVIKAPFNHTVHIVLDVVSCGAWLPIHLICWAVH
jgi:hypothetical protein